MKNDSTAGPGAVVSATAPGFGLLVLLGAVTAFDSVAIDMYLPAFGAIEADLRLASGVMPMSLSVFLVGLAVGQAVCGPLVDSVGRRGPLLLGIILFGAASLTVMLAPNAAWFMAGRFAQGLGGAAGLVIPRAIVSDLYPPSQATRIFTFLIQIQSISPILAPILGGLLLGWLGWKSIFAALIIFAALALAFSVRMVPETLPREARGRLGPGNVLATWLDLLRNRRYRGMTLSAGLVMGTLFGYISASSFVFMRHFNLSASAYSLVFAAVSVGMILVGQLNLYLSARMSTSRNLALGFGVHILFMLLLLGVVFFGWGTLEWVTALLLLAMSSLSLIFGGITAESMYSVDNSQAGSASALLGVAQYALGGGAGLVLGIFHDGTLRPVVIILTCCSALAVLLWRYTDRLPSTRTLDSGASAEAGPELASNAVQAR